MNVLSPCYSSYRSNLSSPILLLIATVIAGIGQGLAFLGGLTAVN